MGGLAGLVSLHGQPVSRQSLDGLIAAGRHLGPDGVGCWASGPAGLVAFKMVTVPEASGEAQPLVDTSRQLVLCFDGRLDNRDELCRLVASEDQPRQGASDSALVLALFRRYGTPCVERLVGDYSLALWDGRQRELFCARSPLGFRPFYWWCDDTTFAFATEVKQLLVGCRLTRRVNDAMLGEVLACRYQSPTDTLWGGLFRLPPGSALQVRGGPPHVWSWYTGPFALPTTRTEADYVEHFLALFDQGLQACLRSSTPVAIQLSGGVDSSSVVCRAAALHRAGTVSQKVQPLSAIFPGEPQDESAWIDQVAAHTGLVPERQVPPPYDWEWARAWTAETLHLPPRPNATVSLALLAGLRARGMRVVLTGEGGDDWLRGEQERWWNRLQPARLVRRVQQEWAAGPARWLMLGELLQGRIGPWVRWKPWATPWPRSDHGRAGIPPWLRPEWVRQIGLDERVNASLPQPLRLAPAVAHRYRRFGWPASPILWENLECALARLHVESRHPFHDRRLAEFLLGVPQTLLRREGRTKHLLREAMRGTVPEAIRLRTTKAKFDRLFVQALDAVLSPERVRRLACVRQGWVDDAVLRESWATARSDPLLGLYPRSYAMPLTAVWNAVAVDLWLTQAGGV
jgi:asparagine synthase (glutamine-hydrolysing)